MQFARQNLEQAASGTIATLPQDTGGIISVDAAGSIATPFNSLGMFRGRADSSGLFAVSIWEEENGLS